MWTKEPFLVLFVAALGWCLPADTTTSRTTLQPIEPTEAKRPQINKYYEVNSTLQDVLDVLDVRTPPKIKQQQKQKLENENSVVGVAIPVDEDSIQLEETTKKLHFYKIERPTTNSGLSTWILLSGQSPSTTKAPPKKPVTTKPVAVENEISKSNKTVVVDVKPNRIVKPIFKKRVTTQKPSSSTESSSKKEVQSSSTAKPKNTTKKSEKETTKLTKIKASLLNNALHKKNNTNSTNNNNKNKQSTTITTAQTSTTKKITKNTSNVSTTTVSTVEKTTLNSTEAASNSTTLDSTSLPMEAKEGDTDLPKPEKKKKNKRKKNKNRRRKPSNETSLQIPEDKPIGTQLYNYLSREIMPTVGVGIAGLMVAAGLASYFIYPFGIARRTYEIDRKDKEGTYYYSDDYSGGIPEEEAIGKVIAGMPENSNNGFNKPAPPRNSFPNNNRYRQVDRRSQVYQNGLTQGSVENVQLSPKDREQSLYGLQPRYPADNQRFVVGNVPKDVIEEITPASVPEHGPRSMKFARRRRKRQVVVPDDSENDIMSDQRQTSTEKISTSTISSTESMESSSTTTMQPENEHKPSIFDLFKELIHLKVRLGLELVQNATRAFSSYVSKVQSRLNEHYNLNSTSRNF